MKETSSDIYSILKSMPGFFGIFDRNSRYIMVNDEGAQWLGFVKPQNMLGQNHFNIKCDAVKLASEWVKQDSLTLASKSSQKFIGYNCYAGNVWRIVLGEKKAFYNKKNEKELFCHFMDITNSSIFDISPFLKKNNGLIKREQVSLTLSKQYLYQKNKYLSVRQSECLFFLIRGKTIKEIARLLKLSPKTVEQYVYDIKFKFGCATKGELIAFAIDNGYINAIPETLFCKS